ncbi:MAG: pinensin family lanthipeptide [Cyclobacteriaceae bacterium]
MKKQKLTLGGLKVESFVTEFESADANTVKGGYLTFTNTNPNTQFCSDTSCAVTFGTGGVCDGPAPTKYGSFCLCD